jgi:hypothetical protein
MSRLASFCASSACSSGLSGPTSRALLATLNSAVSAAASSSGESFWRASAAVTAAASSLDDAPAASPYSATTQNATCGQASHWLARLGDSVPHEVTDRNSASSLTPLAPT